MKDGFLRVAAATPEIKVADPVYNGNEILKLMEEGKKKGAKIMVFPELCLTGYTCGDLFLQDTLLENARNELRRLEEVSKGMDMLVFVGLPFEKGGKLYNVAAAVQNGQVLAFITKMNIPNYAEFYELRHFNPGPAVPETVLWGNREVPFGSNILLECGEIPELIVAGEICEDVWVMDPPSISHAKAGATVIINCSASDETTGKHLYRNSLISGQSARLVCGYVYANAGEGESTQDLVFGGHNMIAENGTVLASSRRFENSVIYGDLDLQRIRNERRKMNTFRTEAPGSRYVRVPVHIRKEDLELSRYIDPAPFVPSDGKARDAR